MITRKQPGWVIPPGGQEPPAVVLEQPVRMAVLVVDRKKIAEVPYRLSAEDDTALGPDRHDARRETVAFDRRGDAIDGLRAQRVNALVRLWRDDLSEHGAGGGHRERGPA